MQSDKGMHDYGLPGAVQVRTRRPAEGEQIATENTSLGRLVVCRISGEGERNLTTHTL